MSCYPAARALLTLLQKQNWWFELFHFADDWRLALKFQTCVWIHMNLKHSNKTIKGQPEKKRPTSQLVDRLNRWEPCRQIGPQRLLGSQDAKIFFSEARNRTDWLKMHHGHLWTSTSISVHKVDYVDYVDYEFFRMIVLGTNLSSYALSGAGHCGW